MEIKENFQLVMPFCKKYGIKKQFIKFWHAPQVLSIELIGLEVKKHFLMSFSLQKKIFTKSFCVSSLESL
jgi:hypothetical protein